LEEELAEGLGEKLEEGNGKEFAKRTTLLETTDPPSAIDATQHHMEVLER